MLLYFLLISYENINKIKLQLLESKENLKTRKKFFIDSVAFSSWNVIILLEKNGPDFQYVFKKKSNLGNGRTSSGRYLI